MTKVTIEEQEAMGLRRPASNFVPALRQAQPTTITPDQARQLDRMVEPDVISVGTQTQTSVTSADIGKFLEPIKVVEQFSPGEQADGIVKLAGVALILSAFVTTALSIYLQPTFEIGATLYFALTTVITLGLYWRQSAYSIIGLAMKRQRYQKDVVMSLIKSNEKISLEKLRNDDRAHERRSQKADRYLDILEGKHNAK